MRKNKKTGRFSVVTIIILWFRVQRYSFIIVVQKCQKNYKFITHHNTTVELINMQILFYAFIARDILVHLSCFSLFKKKSCARNYVYDVKQYPFGFQRY